MNVNILSENLDTIKQKLTASSVFQINTNIFPSKMNA